jgi:hypothetical protein
MCVRSLQMDRNILLNQQTLLVVRHLCSRQHSRMCCSGAPGAKKKIFAPMHGRKRLLPQAMLLKVLQKQLEQSRTQQGTC